jgi:hypothetical protein
MPLALLIASHIYVTRTSTPEDISGFRAKHFIKAWRDLATIKLDLPQKTHKDKRLKIVSIMA